MIFAANFEVQSLKHPRAVFDAAIQLACYSLLVSFAFGLPALAMLYVAIAVMVSTLVDELPKSFPKKEPIAVPAFTPEGYEPGSWAD